MCLQYFSPENLAPLHKVLRLTFIVTLEILLPFLTLNMTSCLIAFNVLYEGAELAENEEK
jgi:hypothetical protein